MSKRFLDIPIALILIAVVSPALADEIELTGTLRDFHARTDANGHPDFEYTFNGSYPLITGMVQSTLGEDSKPKLNLGAILTGANVAVTGGYGLDRVRLMFTDGSYYTYDNLPGTSGSFPIPASESGKTLDYIRVRVDGSSTYYNISDDADHVNTAFNGKITATFTVGTGIPAQWRIASEASFAQWFTNVAGVNQSTPHTIVLNDPDGDGVYRFEASKHNGQDFFPLDGKLFGNEGRSHNYHFTFEVATKFTYTDPADRDPMVFEFSGDDDVWVYINGKLAVDLGGVHGEKYASVNVDSLAQQLGLEVGKNYDFNFFFAERHTTESNFTIETTIQFLSPLYD